MFRNGLRNHKGVLPFIVRNTFDSSIHGGGILVLTFFLNEFDHSSNGLYHSGVDGGLADHGFREINTVSPDISGLFVTGFGAFDHID